MRFRGAKRQQFNTVLDKITAGHLGQRPLAREKGIGSREKSLVFAGTGIMSAWLLSGILRRIPLWSSASELYIGAYWRRVAIMWFGDPPANALAAILGRSACAVSRAVVAPEFSAYIGDDVADPMAQRIEIAPGPSLTMIDVADSTDAWHAMRAMRAASSRRAGPSPCLADNAVSRLLWGPPDLDFAFEKGRFTAIYQLLRRIGVSEAEIAATTGQSRADVAEVLRGGEVTSRDVAERLAKRLDLPRGWL